jgi:hypothetical protein
MQRLEVSGAVRPLCWPLDVKGLIHLVNAQLLRMVQSVCPITTFMSLPLLDSVFMFYLRQSYATDFAIFM